MEIFNNISESEYNELLKQITPIKKEYLRDEAIFFEDDLCASVAIINRGSIKAIKHYTDGHDKILRTLNQKEIIGLSLIFSSNPFYKATFYADTLTSITIISKDDLFKLININKTVLNNVLAYISDSSIKLNEQIKLMSYKTIRQRICYYLYTEYLKNKATSFLITLTKTELASLINAERPSLSFELKKLIDEGIVANQNKLYTIICLDKLLQEL